MGTKRFWRGRPRAVDVADDPAGIGPTGHPVRFGAALALAGTLTLVVGVGASEGSSTGLADGVATESLAGDAALGAQATALTSIGPSDDSAEASASAYSNQSDSEALEALRATHPSLLQHLLWSPPPLGEGERLLGFEDEFTATIEGPNGTKGQIHSGTPIRSSLGDGTPQLVDVTLSAGLDGGHSPANPVVDYSLAASLAGPMQFKDAAIGVSFPDAGAANAQQVNDKLAYLNAWEDTDLLVAPLPDGFTTIQMLRSANSPESFTVDLDLPPGAELEETGVDLNLEGAGVVLPGGESLGISPPMAWDADGNPIETSLDVLDTNSFELRLAHRDTPVRYPLALDPTYTFCSATCGSWWSDWHPYVPKSWNWSMIHGGSWGYPLDFGNSGLWILATQSHSNPAAYDFGESAYWYFNAAGRGERVYRYIQEGLNHNAINSTELMGLFDSSTLRFVNGISSITGVSPGRDNDDLSPFTPAASGPWHYEWKVDHCFVGEPRFACGLADAAHGRADLAGGNPILQLLIRDVTSTQNEPPFAFMRTAYVYTVGGFQPPSVPPDTVIDEGPQGIERDTEVAFEFHGAGAVSRFECKLDGGPWGTCATGVAYQNLPQGRHTFEVRAVDGLNQADPTPDSRTWIIDSETRSPIDPEEEVVARAAGDAYGRCENHLESTGGCLPDSNEHTFCWGDNFQRQGGWNGATHAMDNLVVETILTKNYMSTCTEDTDLIWHLFRHSDLAGGWFCDDGQVDGRICRRGRALMDPHDMQNQREWKEVACHETGHSIGLHHRNYERYDCMHRKNYYVPYPHYSDHSIHHVNVDCNPCRW
jgi:hypothetical protein